MTEAKGPDGPDGDGKRYLDAKSAATWLGCTVSQIYQLIQQGDLRAIDISLGRKPIWRIDLNDMDQFAQRRASRARHSQPGTS